jgi:N-acetylneuraminic acid mutarotase
VATVLTPDLHDKDAKWQQLPLMPTARSGAQAAMLNGKIFFVFGEEKFGGVFNNAEMFDPETELWKELTPMPIGRHGTHALTLGNMIFVPAGGRSMGVRRRLMQIRPSLIPDAFGGCAA